MKSRVTVNRPSDWRMASFSIVLTYSTIVQRGKTAFHATLSGVGVSADNDTSLWAENSKGLTLLARAGDALPGEHDRIDYAAFFTRPAMNDMGQVAFYPALRESRSGNLTSGLITQSTGKTLTLAAMAGDIAPGTDEGTVFLEQGFENPFSSRTVIDASGGTGPAWILGWRERHGSNECGFVGAGRRRRSAIACS